MYFSVTPHPKTYWLKNDFIMGIGCLGNFCFLGRVSMISSVYGGRIGLRGSMWLSFLSGVLAGMEGSQVQL